MNIKMMQRFALCSTVLTALFWTIWFLIARHVPVQTLTIGRFTVSMSRWWDILFAPAWAMILTWFFARPTVRKDANIGGSILIGVGVGSGCGLGILLGHDMGISICNRLASILVYELALMLLPVLVFSVILGRCDGWRSALINGLSAVLIIGLGIGLGAGLGLGLCIATCIATCIALVYVGLSIVWTFCAGRRMKPAATI